MNYSKKDLINVIQGVFDKDTKIREKLDFDTFVNLYFDKIVKRLKQQNGKYKFNREEYQTSVRLYLYYSDEKNIYNLLALAMVESRLFDEKHN